MRTRLSKAIITAMVLFLLSCEGRMEPYYETIFFRSYVSAYTECTVLSVSNYTHNHYTLYTGGHNQTYYPKSEEYDRLCDKHDDMTFNRKLKSRPSGINSFVANDFVTLEIVSDSDFDDAHPAGSSLGDIITFRALSPIKYIRSGYTDTYDWEKSPLFEEFVQYFTVLQSPKPHALVNRNYVHPVKSLVSELTAEDMILLGQGNTNYGIGSLSFEREPTLAKKHTFTVTLTDDEGKVFTTTFQVTFD